MFDWPIKELGQGLEFGVGVGQISKLRSRSGLGPKVTPKFTFKLTALVFGVGVGNDRRLGLGFGVGVGFRCAQKSMREPFRMCACVCVCV